jgi:hypothetical protein
MRYYFLPRFGTACYRQTYGDSCNLSLSGLAFFSSDICFVEKQKIIYTGVSSAVIKAELREWANNSYMNVLALKILSFNR